MGSGLTKVSRRVLRLVMAFSFVCACYSWAQPPDAGSNAIGSRAPATVDVGINTVPHARHGWGAEWLTIGAWIATGSERLRWQVDYWHVEERQPYVGRGFTEGLIVNQVDVTGSWRFRSRRRISPHVFGGVEFSRFRKYYCQRYTYPGLECHKSNGTNARALYGAGIDVRFSSRFFGRVQLRAYVDPSHYAALGRVPLVVGAGWRFGGRSPERITRPGTPSNASGQHPGPGPAPRSRPRS